MKESNALRIAKRYISDAIGAGAIKRKLKKVLMMKVLQKEPEIDYPELRPGDLENAKLFANRFSMVEAFRPLLQGKRIVELGVAFGDFSEFLIKTLEPEQFFAFDIFMLHQVPIIWRKPSKEVFGDMTHREYYAKRLSKSSVPVVIEEGDSSTNLLRYPDKYFDMIYVDAGHDYPSVMKDAESCKQKLKDDGILIFNDYIMFDHYAVTEPNAGVWYGIVQAVNQLVVNHDFEVIGFAFRKDMFCDIAVRRRRSLRRS
jgi:SAM-dependent methyltransferase